MTYEPRHRADVVVDSCQYLITRRVCHIHDDYQGEHRALTLADNTVVPIQRSER